MGLHFRENCGSYCTLHEGKNSMPHKTTQPALELLVGKHYGAPEDIILLDLMRQQNNRMDTRKAPVNSTPTLHQPLASTFTMEDPTPHLNASSMPWIQQAKVVSVSVSAASLMFALGVSFGLCQLGYETADNQEMDVVEYVTEQHSP